MLSHIEEEIECLKADIRHAEENPEYDSEAIIAYSEWRIQQLEAEK